MAAVLRREPTAAMPWLPVLHTPEEDLAFFAREVASSAGLAAVDDGGWSGSRWRGTAGSTTCTSTPSGGAGEWDRRSCRSRPADAGRAVHLWAFERNEAALGFYAAARVRGGRAHGRFRRTRSASRTCACAVADGQRPAAVPSDAEALARVHVRSWQSAYAGLVDADHLARLDPAERAGRWRERLEEAASGGHRRRGRLGAGSSDFVERRPSARRRPPAPAGALGRGVRAATSTRAAGGRGRDGAVAGASRRHSGPEVAGVALWVPAGQRPGAGLLCGPRADPGRGGAIDRHRGAGAGRGEAGQLAVTTGQISGQKNAGPVSSVRKLREKLTTRRVSTCPIRHFRTYSGRARPRLLPPVAAPAATSRRTELPS